jgi:hypothetical protein
MQPDSGEQAQRVLNQMKKMYEEGKIRCAPNVVCHVRLLISKRYLAHQWLAN